MIWVSLKANWICRLLLSIEATVMYERLRCQPLGIDGVVKISAGNYGGKLGEHKSN